jgi:cysteinyl-tRNA synthetase
MKLNLFNTESRRIEEIEGSPIRMYTCGPTIYDFAHIGNFRTFICEDLLRRTLQFLGYSVIQAMNITDIDDKTIRGAIAQGRSLKEFTDPFRKAFFEDLQTLRMERVEFYPEATEFIPDMIQFLEVLVQKGIAYRSPNGSIYFSIRKAPRYGRLSHFTLSDLKANASGENEADEYDKEHISDFVLWKAYDAARDGTIFWESPFGPGRPGWHLECSVMAIKLLGHTIDLHCGGVDLIFPHHENEIAQSECCSGELFVRHWMHVEHLLVDHKKMSKSLGNFYTLRDLLDKGYTGRQIRYLLLSTHYRTQLNFTFQSLDAAKASLQRVEDFHIRLGEVHGKGEGSCEGLLRQADLRFRAALAEDLNCSAALAVLFDLIREGNGLIDTQQLSQTDAQAFLHLLHSWNRVLGILPDPMREIPEELTHLLTLREQARKEKNFALSDRIRMELAQKGYVVEDTAGGPRLKIRTD